MRIASPLSRNSWRKKLIRKINKNFITLFSTHQKLFCEEVNQTIDNTKHIKFICSRRAPILNKVNKQMEDKKSFSHVVSRIQFIWGDENKRNQHAKAQNKKANTKLWITKRFSFFGNPIGRKKNTKLLCYRCNFLCVYFYYSHCHFHHLILSHVFHSLSRFFSFNIRDHQYLLVFIMRARWQLML